MCGHTRARWRDFLYNNPHLNTLHREAVTAPAMTDTLHKDLRIRCDRRKTPTRALSRYTLHGRRRSSRRHGDQTQGYYVDRYETRWLAAAAGLMVLGGIDAAITLYLMEHGAIEVNPLMVMLLDRNADLFLGVKLAVTCLAALIMISHVRFNILKGLPGSRLLLIGLGLYAALVGYELHSLL